MIPHGMFDSYRRYKDDTDTIANWLAKSATACGYEFQNGRKIKKSKTFKKKQNGDKVITIPQFVELAKFLANHSVTELSQQSCKEFLMKLDQVIEARNIHNAWYNAHVYNDKNSHIAHVFFVDILCEVRTLLGPTLPSRASESPQTGHKSAPLIVGRPPLTPQDRNTHEKNDTAAEPKFAVRKAPEDLPEIRGRTNRQTFRPANPTVEPSTPSPAIENRFARLEIEDVDEKAEVLPETALSGEATVPRTPSPHYAAEQITDDQELWLAIRCFFDDLVCIRQFIEQSFEIYNKDRSQLWMVSVATDAAINLVRRAELEFEEHFPGHNLADGARLLYETECRVKNHQSTKNLKVTSLSKPFHFEDWDEIEPRLIPALAMLEAFVNVEKPWVQNFMVSKYKGSVPTSADGKTALETYKKQLGFVDLALPDLALVAKYIPDMSVCDQLTQYIATSLKTKSVSITAAFALQAVLDIRSTLGKDMSKGFVDLERAALGLDKNIERSIAIHQKKCGDDTAEANFYNFTNTFRIIDDNVQSDAITFKRKAHGFPFDKDIGFKMMKLHPLLCGNMIFKLRYTAARDATEWCNASSAIFKAMHLYNASKAEGYITRDWEAMEELIKIYSPVYLFVGDRPTAEHDYYKRFCLASGYSVRFFARDGCGCNPRSHRGKLLNYHKARDFKLATVAPVMTRFFERFTDGNERASTEAMFEVERRGLTKKEFEVVEIDEEGNEHVVRRTTLEEDPQYSKQILLNGLVQVLHDERPAFEFDYLKLDRECWAMLEMLAKMMETPFEDIGYDALLKSFTKKHNIPNVVYPILSEVSIEKSKAGCPDCKMKYSTHGLKLLKQAASVVEQAIEHFDGNKIHTLYRLDWSTAFNDMQKAAAEAGFDPAHIREWLEQWWDEEVGKQEEKTGEGVRNPFKDKE